VIRRVLSPHKALRTLRKTAALLDGTLAGVTHEQATSLRDGADGWSVLFIVCHLRDYEIAWRERIEHHRDTEDTENQIGASVSSVSLWCRLFAHHSSADSGHIRGAGHADHDR